MHYSLNVENETALYKQRVHFNAGLIVHKYSYGQKLDQFMFSLIYKIKHFNIKNVEKKDYVMFFMFIFIAFNY